MTDTDLDDYKEMVRMQAEIPHGTPSNTVYDTDDYGVTFNGAQTYTGIAADLIHHHAVVTSWTDNLGTMFDVLFSYQPVQRGTMAGGGSADDSLFFGVRGYGLAAFPLHELHPSYIEEKLRMHPSATVPVLAELINGVIAELNEHRKEL